MDKQKDFEKGWEDYKTKRKQQTEEMIGIIQKSVGGCARNWASLIAEELLKHYQPKISEGAVVLTKEEYEELQKGVKTHNYTATLNAMEADRWLEGYKFGFKEGVIALKTQLTNNAQYGFSMGVGFYTIEADEIDEICEELEGENDG